MCTEPGSTGNGKAEIEYAPMTEVQPLPQRQVKFTFNSMNQRAFRMLLTLIYGNKR